ncbi:hypothetical protein G4V62_00735 [Bacillaceae bacterium SIJ1]|uniref:hypothetical protein n=1 Tax=Litoribacterium kuwaitense TaxID=1398745 RepID=UPI0013EE2FF0|nr:hypothetical protein [Litoribacterium kuwaitense]NGP43558.1 hypothetical protein [Litoribacterium kuwaitense]
MREGEVLIRAIFIVLGIVLLYRFRFRLFQLILSQQWLRSIVVRRFAGPYIRKKLSEELFR